ncbi:T9SS type A sorting domain-containing protein [Chryseobacterium joostei]|uniref:T9SS type A sorting domain-containing protein n=1 Tax=Chryseobacterium joostei TaxID=112234 RepID=UPI003D1140CF
MSGKLLLFSRVKTGSTWGNAVYYALDGSDINPLNPNITSSAIDCTTFTGTIPEGALAVGTEYGIGADFYKTSSGNGGLSIDDLEIIQENTTLSVSEVSKVKTFVYPTPFLDVLKISNIEGIKSITINDAGGRLVKSFFPNTELDLSTLNDGLYFISLYMQDGTVKNYKNFKKR